MPEVGHQQSGEGEGAGPSREPLSLSGRAARRGSRAAAGSRELGQTHAAEQALGRKAQRTELHVRPRKALLLFLHTSSFQT